MLGLALALLSAAPCGAAPRRALVIGLDGLDWSIAGPLMERGRMPNLASLAAAGSTGTMRVPPPLRSPAIWTSAATGVSPERHGISEFFEGTRRVSSASRKAEALWETASASSQTVAVVGWLATWPAEPVRGAMITDQALNPAVREGRVFPLDALSGFPVWAAWDFLGLESAARLDRFLPFRWDPAYARLPQPLRRRHDLVKKRLAWVFMRDESHVRILEALLKREPALAMIHLWGADHVSHAFWTAGTGAAGEDDRRDFGGVVAAYYEYLDAVVGRLRRAAGPDVLVAALSDHGFQAWTAPPGDPHAFLTGNHAPDAVLLLAGPGVRAGARLESPRILDLAPTLARWLALAPPAGYEGRVLEEAFAPGALADAVPPRAPLRRPAPGAPSELSAAEAQRLRAMGYIR